MLFQHFVSHAVYDLFYLLGVQAPGPSCARLELGEASSPYDILWDYCVVWPTGQDQCTIHVERPLVKARHVANFFP